MTHPQYRKVLLQGHVALESHGLAARARLASTEKAFIGPVHRTINSVKKLQRVFSWRVSSAKSQTGVFFDHTHIIPSYIRTQTDTNV